MSVAFPDSCRFRHSLSHVSCMSQSHLLPISSRAVRGVVRRLQVMALLAYLMENKNVFGPHLIIVPNAVIVNWKAELTQWLPNVRCVYYVGTKDERSRKYAAEVQSLQFNVLVTTYEFIMRDRAKLSKVGASPLLAAQRP